eukprot:Awhi_evm1s10592
MKVAIRRLHKRRSNGGVAFGDLPKIPPKKGRPFNSFKKETRGRPKTTASLKKETRGRPSLSPKKETRGRPPLYPKETRGRPKGSCNSPKKKV